MKIAKVEAFNLRVPIPKTQQHVSDFGIASSFQTALVKITLENGLSGWGEGRMSAGSIGNHHSICQYIESEIAPVITGMEAGNITLIWDTLYNGTRQHHALKYGHVFPVMSRRGITVSAISAIDIALWDLFGKSTGLPVHQLLGGKRADSFPAYGSGGWTDASKIGEEMARYRDIGQFKTLKMRVGAQDGSAEASAARVAAARKALGTDIEICCDAHGTFTVSQAKTFCHLVKELGIGWLEEPVAADDIRGMAEVRASTHIAISAGESASTRFEFRDLIDARAVDIVQPDPAICGGITESRKIAALCEAANLRLAPHLWTGAPAFAAGLHLLAASSAGFTVEYSLGANPLIHDLIEESFTVVNGKIDIPERPGLGITVREDYVKKYSV
ncbi:mandelate racemase/muconate lactonizing enzyme family protein [Parasalinivibrio latis]|uniref:mandelate racemase/muconate lactonizing enzyme family protein n=1 Tax=Parasalinivibrio latis TaxID=2952610 RepID=UPI0030E05706